MSTAGSATASCRPSPSITSRIQTRSRPLKRGLCRQAGHRQSVPPARHTNRDLVPGRGQDRAEEQDHEAMGEAGNATLGTARSADQIGLHLRGNLPAGGQGGRPRTAVLQHQHPEPASGGNLTARCTRRPRRGAHGPGRLAPDAEARAARQHLDRADPLEKPGAQPAGECLGSSCVTTGCRTGCSAPTTRSSTTAAMPGTSSSINPGGLCRSASANGRRGSDQ